jgi:hypothetical protein
VEAGVDSAVQACPITLETDEAGLAAERYAQQRVGF